MSEKFSDEQTKSALEAHPEWAEVSGEIQRTFLFDDFLHAMRFVNAVAERAESVLHHPDILVRYNRVTLTLSTHDAGGITQKDFDFADFADGFSAASA